MKEACDLCRSAGQVNKSLRAMASSLPMLQFIILHPVIHFITCWQPWRAATLCPFGGFEHFPSIDALVRNGKNRILQAIELESGIGHQWRLWKWASYCASEVVIVISKGSR